MSKVKIAMFRASIDAANQYLEHGFNKMCHYETNLSLNTISRTRQHKCFNQKVYNFMIKEAKQNKSLIDKIEIRF